MIKLLILTYLSLTSISLFADTSRYPYENFSFAGEDGGVSETEYEGERLYLALRYDPSFSNSQKAIITRGTQLFLERAMKPAVIGCAFATATKDFIHSDVAGKSSL